MTSEYDILQITSFLNTIFGNKVSSEQLLDFFRQSIKNMELRAVIGEHMLNQFKARY